jgi:replication factor A1
MQKIKSASISLSCRRKMTTQEIIRQIRAKKPEISEKDVLDRLQAEKSRNGGLLGDETLLRLIAAKFGVEVEQNRIHNSGNLSTSRLFAGLNDVTVAGRLVAVYQSRTFAGEKPGKFATLMIVDNDGILRVVLWNDKADLVEKGELKEGQAIRLLHGYTREDRYNKVELHIGSKGQIQIDPPEKGNDYPTLEAFTTKIGSLNKAMGTAHLSGKVKEILGLRNFTRIDASNGVAMRFILEDDSGKVDVVAWDERATEIERTVRVDTRLQLVNAKVKENRNGTIEVHVDLGTFISVPT